MRSECWRRVEDIGAIYGIEEAGGVRGLILELVEGETLAERIAAAVGASTRTSHGATQAPRALPIADALAISGGSPRRSTLRTRRASCSAI